MRTLISSLLCGFILMAGCKSKNSSNALNSVQEKFTSFYTESCREYRKNNNDIQRSEYFKQHKLALNKLVDSAGLLRNWQGKITYLSFIDAGSNVSRLFLTIEVPVDNLYAIKFDCEKYMTTSLVDSMLLYNQLKQVKVGDKVFFDGIIKRDLKKDVKYGSLETNDVLTVCSPHIQFFAVSIAKDTSAIKKSANFEKGINVAWSALTLASDVYAHAVTDSIGRQQQQVYQQQLAELSPSFTTNDKMYLRELITSFEAQYK